MISYEIIYSLRAKSKLAQIARYLAENDFDEEIIDRIKNEISKKLSSNPNSAGKLAENIPADERNVRQVNTLRKNVIYFKVHQRKVVILTIRAGRMDLDI